MKKSSWFFLFSFIAWLALAGRAGAQEQAELHLRMSRTFGYASGSDIQGLFTLKASGPDDLLRVVFYLDEQPLGEASQAPFELRLNTDEHSLGEHDIYAQGYTASGRVLYSNRFRVRFVTAEEGWKTVRRILLPLLAVLFGVMMLSFAVTFFTSGKLKQLPSGTPRQYGMSGGAICPRCQRPFARHLFAPNLLTGKLERCPFCGKWSVVAARPLDDLRAAEAAELEGAQSALAATALTEEEKLRKELDDSRYQDM